MTFFGPQNSFSEHGNSEVFGSLTLFDIDNWIQSSTQQNVFIYGGNCSWTIGDILALFKPNFNNFSYHKYQT